MPLRSWILPAVPIGVLGAVVWWVAGCSPMGPADGQADVIKPAFGSGSSTPVPVSAAPSSPSATTSAASAAALLRSVNLKKDYVRRGTHGRKVVRRMTPRYITIHSTQNWSAQADAERHALALKNGKLRAPKHKRGNRIGYLIWHFTVDQSMAVQHMPTNEQGEHADFDGPGNRYSIGVEMCENSGNSRTATVDRAARLSAWLMYKHGIPVSRVVPHYHWPRRGVSKPHKNCPHFLLDNGRPGAKWKAFQRKVSAYHKQIRSADLASL